MPTNDSHRVSFLRTSVLDPHQTHLEGGLHEAVPTRTRPQLGQFVRHHSISDRRRKCGNHIDIEHEREGRCRSHLCVACHQRRMGVLRKGTQAQAKGETLTSFIHAVLTVPHARHEPLEAVWDRLKSCRGQFLHGRWLSDHADAYRLRTHITWSEQAGWHVHDHLVLGFRSFPKIERKRTVAVRRWARSTSLLGVGANGLYYEERPLPGLKRYVFADHFKRSAKSECRDGLQVGDVVALASTGVAAHVERWWELESAALGRTWTGVGGLWHDQGDADSRERLRSEQLTGPGSSPRDLCR